MKALRIKKSRQMYVLKKILSQVNVEINDRQNEQFQKYIDLILKWNKRTNLISRKDESNILENHVLESLAFLVSFELSSRTKVIDVGSGAGFPGLPIGLIKSDVNFLLVESKRMKSLFLKEVILQLKLKNVEVISERIEKLALNNRYENEFDFAFSRAVDSLEVIYSWVKEIIKPGGFYIAWKGGNVKQEIGHLEKREKNVAIDIIQMDERLVTAKKNRVFVRVKRLE